MGILEKGCYKRGTWTLEEDTVLLEYLFKNKPCKIETIKSISYKSMENIREVKRSKQTIQNRYEKYLKPILLNYHLGTLNNNWKYNYVAHILNKNYKATKEVIWEEMLDIFPGQSRMSLVKILTDAARINKK